MTSTTKVNVEKNHSLLKSHYNEAVIDFNFGKHGDLYTLKSDIHIGLAASENITFLVDKSSCLLH